MEELRKKLVSKQEADQRYFIVYSMILEIFKNARMTRSYIFREKEGGYPNKGFCTSQKAMYHDYKLHCVCSTDGVFNNFDLSSLIRPRYSLSKRY